MSDDGLDEYLWDYMNESRTLKEISDERLIQFSDDLFLYTQKVKRKMDVFSYEYDDDDDWDELKKILDEYEIYGSGAKIAKQLSFTFKILIY